MAEELSHILRPRPQRPFETDRQSTSGSGSIPSGMGTPSKEPMDLSKLSVDKEDKPGLMSRTVSGLNLTSSTLFGIYSQDGPATPFGLGTQTPVYRSSVDDIRPPIIGAYEPETPASPDPPPHQSRQNLVVLLGIRTIFLFLAGIAYGLVISQLHDSERIAPVQLQTLDRRSWSYVLGWGGAGIVLGALLPWVDTLWEDVLGYSRDVFPSNKKSGSGTTASRNEDGEDKSASAFGSEAIWNPAVRSVTAFIGIAFAIRRLPWQSTLQMSLTLALVNPVLWYLFDRSKPGFLLSAIIGIAGTFIALGISPDIVPSPATPSPSAHAANASYQDYLTLDGRVSVESIGVGTWIASVLFCSSLCFGNIGRRLAYKTPNP